MSNQSQSETKFRFQNRTFKKHNQKHIIYNGSFAGRPTLSNYVEKQIAKVSSELDALGKSFTTCIIEKRPWTLFRPCNVTERGIAVNYTFITGDGELMWRKTGKSHGTRNKIYTKKLSKYYTHWLNNPTIE